MIEGPLVHLTLEEEDREFVEYVKAISDNLKIEEKFTFFYLEKDTPRLLDMIIPKEDVEERAQRIIGDLFPAFELKIVSDPIEKVIENLGSSWIFLRYERTLFRKALYERVIHSLDHVKLWIYKRGRWEAVKNICVPIDLSSRSKAQVEFAQNLAKFFNANIRLLHALSISHMKDKVSQREYEDLKSLKEEEARHMFNDLLHEGELLLEFIDDDPIKALPKYINSSDCKLTVVSRRSKQEIRPVGRVSLHIIRGLRCPVIVL